MGDCVTYPLNQFQPVVKEYHNTIFKAPDSMPECSDLNVRRESGRIIMNFQLVSLAERKRFMETGEITITLYGNSLPPISILAGDAVQGDVE